MTGSIDLTTPTTAQGLKPATRDRTKIASHFTWDLSHIYPDWSSWEADLERLRALMASYQKLEGTLAEGAHRILEASRLSDELGQLAYRVYQYPGLMRSQDTRDNAVQGRLEQVRLAFAAFKQATAWYTPELLRIPEGTMKGWLAETPDLAPYRFGIEESYRMQEHVLDEDGERLLAYASTFNGTPSQTYTMLADADVKFPTVTLSDGTEVVASHANYSQGLHSLRSQTDRETLFKAHFTVYDASPNTFAAIYNGVLQKDWVIARSRRYASTLEAKLDDDNIPATVVENLIATARAGSGALQRYHRLRKRSLGVERYRYFDAYLPLVEVEWPLPYESVSRLLVESVEVFGADYQSTVQRAFDDRWIDVYENEGKRSGAFSAGVYGVHPYMLLNYADTLNDAFTVAHEMGHTMHTVLSHETQPFATSEYTIFVAEVASMTNESLFLDRRAGRGGGPGAPGRAPAARHRRHLGRLLSPGDVRRLRIAGPPRSRGRAPDHVRGVAEHLPRSACSFLWRRPRRPGLVPQHVGADPPLLRLALLRLSVRDVEGRGHRAPPQDDQRPGRRSSRDRWSLSRAAPFRRQRPPDHTAPEGWSRLHHDGTYGGLGQRNGDLGR